jgi:hypothetical protein
MKTLSFFLLATKIFLYTHLSAQSYDIQVYSEFNVGTTLGQTRAVPVQLGKDQQPHLLLVYGEDKSVDPFMGMFFFPTNSLKFALYTMEGERLWMKELHRGNIPGSWFNPVFPFDLDQDGVEEIWFVYNTSEDHPLDIKQYRLACMDPRTGEITSLYPWKGLDWADYTMSQRYRHMIFGGYHHGDPVLVTAQGTYTQLQMQGWDMGMVQRWDLVVGKDERGSRGSHTSAIVDINNDGSDEFFYGERCINIGTGKHLFIADEHVYDGHSDVVSPVFNYDANRWYIFTARESGYGNYAPPRVVTFKDNGHRQWSDLEVGHMDMGWVARVGPEGAFRGLAVKVGGKTAGSEGVFRTGIEEYVWDPFTGKRVPVDLSLYERWPVDINGNGIHELVGSGDGTDGKLLTYKGVEIANFGDDAQAIIISKILTGKDGEQIVLFYPDGRIKIVYDRNAKDTPVAKKRYSHPFYLRNQKQSAVGHNIMLLGGI